MECTEEYWYQTARHDGLTFLTKVAELLYQFHDKTLNCALEETFFLFEDRFSEIWRINVKLEEKSSSVVYFFPIQVLLSEYFGIS